MLYEIDDSIVNVDFSDADNYNALDNLVASYTNGLHLLIVSRSAAEFLLALDGLGRNTRKSLERMALRAVDNNAVRQCFDWSVLVVDSGAMSLTGCKWRISLKEFLRPELCGKMTLLGENGIDCDIFLEAAKHVMAANKVRGIRLSARKQGGGGSAIAHEYDNLLNNKESPVLCITDGDRLCPESSASAVSKKCTRIMSRHQWISAHYDIGYRDIENIVPLEFFVDSAQGNVSVVAESAIGFVGSTDERVIGYWDVKNGINGRWIFNLSRNSRERTFWVDVWNLWVKNKNDCAIDEGCEKSPCACVLFSGLGESALDVVLEYLRHNSPQKALERVKANHDKWMEVGQLILSWVCAPDIRRV